MSLAPKLLLAMMAVTSWILIVPRAAAGIVDPEVSVEVETQRLEALNRGGKLSSLQRGRLSEIYFLTSRCVEVRALLSPDPEIQPSVYCACGGTPCPASAEKVSVVVGFRHLIEERHVPLESAQAQAAWKRAGHLPEARYHALRSLRSRISAGEELSSRLSEHMSGLERQLEEIGGWTR